MLYLGLKILDIKFINKLDSASVIFVIGYQEVYFYDYTDYIDIIKHKK